MSTLRATHGESATPLPDTAAGRGGQRVDRKRFGTLANQYARIGWIRPLVPVLVEWTAIALLLLGAAVLHEWWAYLIAGPLVAGRQMALGILMHEASHARLSPSRRVNDWVGDLLCAAPLGASLARFRKLHLAHHRSLATDGDPDHVAMEGHAQYRFPMPRRRFLRLLLRDVTGLSLLHSVGFLLAYHPFGPGLGWRSWIVRRGRSTYAVMSSVDRFRALLFPLLVVAAILMLPTGLRLRVALLWTIPYWTGFVALQRLRAVADHRGVPNRHELDASRHVDARWFERLLVCPWNVNYHIAHHLFPSVPLYRLPELHRQIMADPEIRAQAHVTRGYGPRGVIGELTYAGPRRPDAAATG